MESRENFYKESWYTSRVWNIWWAVLKADIEREQDMKNQSKTVRIVCEKATGDF